MRFLIDNALSPLLSKSLCNAGYDALHVRDIELQTADDEVILKKAMAEDRIIISADTDFGTLLALWQQTKPLIILFRRRIERRPQQQLTLLLTNLARFQEALEKGSIIVIEEHRIRLRSLPIKS
ncbi:MAG: DUF5615 family PIN-like protein [Candidatus Anammoxibacter sp.]